MVHSERCNSGNDWVLYHVCSVIFPTMMSLKYCCLNALPDKRVESQQSQKLQVTRLPYSFCALRRVRRFETFPHLKKVLCEETFRYRFAINLYSLPNTLQVRGSIKPDSFWKSCSQAVCVKEGASESAGTSFTLRSGDMDYIQVADITILDPVRTTIALYDRLLNTHTECPKSRNHSLIPTKLGTPLRVWLLLVFVAS